MEIINTAGQLLKAKKNLAVLKKSYPKGFPKFQGFTLQLHYGGNKVADITDIEVCGVATKDENNSKVFYDLLVSEMEGNVDFWTKAVERDIQTLKDALNKDY